jgi:NAD(P)-dependent dehydrogenase (short-subunit alcohol dehydrogenase family)
MSLEGKVALVTGAGSGMGRAIATSFAEESASVVVNDVVWEAAQKTVEGIGPAGARCLAWKADVSSGAKMKSMFRASSRALGHTGHPGEQRRNRRDGFETWSRHQAKCGRPDNGIDERR